MKSVSLKKYSRFVKQKNYSMAIHHPPTPSAMVTVHQPHQLIMLIYPTASNKAANFTRCVLLIIVLFVSNGLLADPLIALKGGQIIDGISDQPLSENVILVQGNRILKIGDESIIPDTATIMDLGNSTLLPGFIDCHAHPLMYADDYQTAHLSRSSAYKALKGLKSMQNLLGAGWTTMRVMGDADVFYANQDIRRVIEEGLFQGPRITGAAHYLSITGGGGDVNYLSPEQNVIPDGLVVNGPEEIRRAIRNEVKYGSDWIKLLVTGAFLSVGDSPRNVHFSAEELKVATEEAARLDVPVAAHAHATEGIRLAVEAGVRSIEHGTYLDEETMELMSERGTFLVPTIYIGDMLVEESSDIREKEANDDYYNNYRHIFLDLVYKAHKKGVKVAVGTDLGGYNYDPTISAREMKVLVEAGMTPMEAIMAGTRVGAELLRWDDKLGTLKAGMLADIIAVPGKPLENMSLLEQVIFVMKDGEVAKR